MTKVTMSSVRGNGIIKIISVNMKLGGETRMPQIFICYDLTYDEENMIFET
jgi:hypothetical protein